MIKHKFTMVTLIIALIGAAHVFSTAAQISGYSPIFISSNHITNARWSNDSTLFTFQEVPLIGNGDNLDTDMGFYTIADTWHGYQIVDTQSINQHMNLISSKEWLLASQLSPRAVTLPRATYNDGEISFVFVSPNGKFAVYAASERAENGYFPLEIANLETGQTVVSNQVFVYGLTNFTAAYHVIWSGDSSAFTIETTSAYAAAFVHYVTGYTEDLNDITFTRINQGIPVEAPKFLVYRPWALSYDGTRLLSGNSGLSMWDTQKSPEDSLIMIEEYDSPGEVQTLTRGATFTSDETAVLYLSTEGLMQYDIATGEKSILDANIKATVDIYGYFSPDATHLGVIEYQRDLGKWAAYVIPVNTEGR